LRTNLKLTLSRPLPGHYFPDLHFISAEMEDTTGPVGRWGREETGYKGSGYALPDGKVSETCASI